MKVNGIAIDDTFAEAFGMSGTGVIITADSMQWARQAAVTMSGFGTSVIGAGAEVGIDRELKPEETPDGRPGRARAAVRLLAGIRELAAQDPRRSVRAHEPRLRLLRGR